jgi:hypothetical protein
MLTIKLQEFEVNDSAKGNYFYLWGQVDESGFSGWSNFVVSEADLRAFWANLSEFAKDFTGHPELRAGWGEECYFRLGFQKWKTTGPLWVDGEIATGLHHEEKVEYPRCSHRCEFSFSVDPAQLDRFLQDLSALMKGRKEGVILEPRKELTQ